MLSDLRYFSLAASPWSRTGIPMEPHVAKPAPFQPTPACKALLSVLLTTSSTLRPQVLGIHLDTHVRDAVLARIKEVQQRLGE